MHQRQFLLRTATPQQLNALVQVLCNVRIKYIVIPEKNKQKVLPYKDALINLAEKGQWVMFPYCVFGLQIWQSPLAMKWASLWTRRFQETVIAGVLELAE